MEPQEEVECNVSNTGNSFQRLFERTARAGEASQNVSAQSGHGRMEIGGLDLILSMRENMGIEQIALMLEMGGLVIANMV